MISNSTKPRMVKVVSKVIITVLAVCLLFTALPYLTPDALPSAEAETVTLSSNSLSTINTSLAGYDPGTIVNLTLSGDIDFSKGRDDASFSGIDGLNRDITGIVVPAGITVNLFMNGKTISFSVDGKDAGAHWQVGRVAGIVNHGTLNIYSGATTNQSGSGSSYISLFNSYTGMDVSDAREYAYVNFEGIHNEGTLAVYKNVNIKLESHLTYDGEGDAAGVSIVNNTVTGIYNASATASCVLYSAKLNCLGEAMAVNGNYNIFTTRKAGGSRSIVYGVYGGGITVNGNTDITARAENGGTEDTGAGDFGRARVVTVCYDLCTDKSINVYGGTMKYSSSISQQNDGMKNGTSRVYTGGIFYKTGGTLPTMADGNIQYTDPSANIYTYSAGTRELFNAPVSTSSTMPIAGDDLIQTASWNTWDKEGGEFFMPTNYYPTGTFAAGQYKDESGNSYSTASSVTDGQYPANIVRGAAEGTYRVHVVYRYWLTSAKNAVDTSVVGSSGNAGYSYIPLSDATNLVDSNVVLSGLSSVNSLVKTGNSAIRYVSGGESCNDNYWVLYNLTSLSSSDWFSDYNVTSSNNRGDIFRNFQASGYTDIVCGEGQSSPLFVFVDYYKKNATTISASVDTGKLISYTGSAIKATDLGLKITDSVYGTDYTSDYNVNFDNSSKIAVSFSYTGTNAAGVAVSSENGQLPRDAGTYSVTLNVPENTEYNKNEVLYKNRHALDFSFNLTINQASPSRGTLPASVNLVYGEKLADKVFFNTYNALGVSSDGNVAGTFSFTSASDGATYKPAGLGNVSITWTPTYAPDATVKNYKTTEFTVGYTIDKASLSITPNAAAVTYGEEVFSVPFSVTFNGLCGNDNTDSVRQALSAAMGYTIMSSDGYVSYSTEIGVGSYSVRPTFASIPAVLSNYEYSYVYGSVDNPDGVLTVAKRPLTVKATAVGREYAPDNYSVNVTFEVVSGKFGQDDIRVSSSVGALSNNNAGTRQVSGITTQLVRENTTGAASANYIVTEVTYETGSNLTVQIQKATPTATVPSVAEMFYRQARTLDDVALTGFTSSVAGEWQWEDRTINPTVAVSLYSAKFIPSDSANYETKIDNVTINVKPTPVSVTYSATVAYGDNIPNITAYTYTAVQDPSFNIDLVDTTGNITPYTTYVKGSPVVAGGYSVQIVAPNYRDTNGNYTFTTENGVINVVPRNIVFTVSDASITYGATFSTSPSAREITYDASRLVGSDEISAVTSNGEEPQFSFSSDFNNATNYAVGSYYISATPNFTCSSNYTVSVVNGTLTVNKASLILRANSITLSYNSNIPDLTTAYTIIGAKRSETIEHIVTTGFITVDTTYYKGASVTADGYPVTIDISTATFANYTVQVNPGVINVIKATPTVTTLPTAVITYGQNLGAATFAGGVILDNVAGSFAYDSASTTPAYSSAPYTIYTATFIPVDTANYNTVGGMYISLTVNKKPISGALAVVGTPMKGQTLTVDVSGLNPNEIGVYSFVWQIDGSSVATGTTLTLTDAHVNKAITVIATANNFYTGTASYTTTAVAPVLTSVSLILTQSDYAGYFSMSGLTDFGGDTNVVYNAQPHPVTFAQLASTFSTNAIGSVTVKYNGSSVIPTAAGTYNVTIDIDSPENLTSMTIIENNGITYDTVSQKYVYSPISNYEIGTLVIQKAAYNVTVTVADKVYDGYTSATVQSIAQSGACTLPGGLSDDVSFNEAAASYSFTDSSAGQNKTVTVSGAALTGSAADNYQLNVTIANGATANISKRVLNVAIDPVEREYEANNYNIELGFVVDASTVAPADTLAYVYVNEAAATGTAGDYHAGLQNLSVSNVELAGSKADNYVLNLTNAHGLTVQILKATPYYPLPQTGTVYYVSGRTLSAISLGDSRWSWKSDVANTVPGAGNHTYTAVYTPDDINNYAEVEYDVDFEVRKAAVTVRAAGFTVTYGDGEPTYYYDITGLTGSDTVRNALDGYVLLTCSYEAGSNIGNYPVVLTGAFESPNYSFTYVNGNVAVKARKANITAIAAGREYAQGNLSVDVSFSTLSNIYSGDAGNVYLEGVFPITGTIDSDTAGVHTVAYTSPALAGSKAGNYVLNFVNPNLTVNIAKAHIAGVILPISATVAYSQKLSTATFTSSYTGTQYGTFQMENPNSTPAAVGTTSNTYKVTFTPFNSTNYATVSEYITLTVTSCQLDLQLSYAGTPQVGNTLTVVTNNIPSDAVDYIVYEWYRLNSATDPVTSGYRVASEVNSYTLTESDAGKYIVCVATQADNSPYIIEASIATDNAAEGESLSFWQRLVKWFYNIMSALTQIFGGIFG